MERFEVVRATTPALLDQAYQLRYQVYCVENPYEEADEDSGGRETDTYDERSIHALLFHRRSGAVAGTVRLILPGGAQDAPLPIYAATQGHEREWLHRVPYWHTAEISRFAISREFLCRWARADDRQILRYITIGLIRGVLDICHDTDIQYVCALMERALIRLLRGLGIVFEHVGGQLDYHGARHPCISAVTHLVESAPSGSLWEYASHLAAPILQERAA